MMSESVCHSQNQYGNSIMGVASVKASRRTESGVVRGRQSLFKCTLLNK